MNFAPVLLMSGRSFRERTQRREPSGERDYYWQLLLSRGDWRCDVRICSELCLLIQYSGCSLSYSGQLLRIHRRIRIFLQPWPILPAVNNLEIPAGKKYFSYEHACDAFFFLFESAVPSRKLFRVCWGFSRHKIRVSPMISRRNNLSGKRPCPLFA